MTVLLDKTPAGPNPGQRPVAPLAHPPRRGRSRRVVAAVVALAVTGGLAIATVGAYGTVEELEHRASALEAQLDTQQEARVEAEGLAAEAQDELAVLKEAGAAAEAALDERAAALEEAEADVKARESAVTERENAVTEVETAVEASRLQPGTYLVPEEVSPGRYRTVEDTTFCYMSQDRGDDIIDNLLEEAGRPVFTVQDVAGTTFQIDPDCGPVTKID